MIPLSSPFNNPLAVVLSDNFLNSVEIQQSDFAGHKAERTNVPQDGGSLPTTTATITTFLNETIFQGGSKGREDRKMEIVGQGTREKKQQWNQAKRVWLSPLTSALLRERVFFLFLFRSHYDSREARPSEFLGSQRLSALEAQERYQTGMLLEQKWWTPNIFKWLCW